MRGAGFFWDAILGGVLLSSVIQCGGACAVAVGVGGAIPGLLVGGAIGAAVDRRRM